MISFLNDLLLNRSAAEIWLRFLMHLTFYFHFAFVLFMLGASLISLYSRLLSHSTHDHEEELWDHEMHKKFLIPKALAVTLGVGVLLATQLYFALPFYTSYVFFGPYWLSSFVLMIFAFLLLEYANHKYFKHPTIALATDIFGVIILMTIPAIFVAIVVGMEYSNRWISLTAAHFQFSGRLIFHWLTRYLHVIGAAIVFGAGFHYLVAGHGKEERQKKLESWMIIGMLIQFVVGGVLIPLAVGIGAASLFLWKVINRVRMHSDRPSQLGPSLYILPVILLTMLLTRQYIQNKKVLPLLHSVEKNAAAYNKELVPFQQQRLASCSICHALTGRGTEPAGVDLNIPPENIPKCVQAGPKFTKLSF
jgi:hypothetical protein